MPVQYYRARSRLAPVAGANDSTVNQAIETLPAELRDSVRRWCERFSASTVSGLAPGDLHGLLRLVACSEFAARTLLRDEGWFVESLLRGCLQAPADIRGLREFASEIAAAGADVEVCKRRLRRFRNRRLLHVLWRTVRHRCPLDESLAALSSLADALIRAALEFAERELTSRYGAPVNAAGEPIPLLILAMGKLGGQELNFSSDVDLVFVHPEDGGTAGEREITAHEFFTRQIRLFATLLEDVTEDGFVYRVDTRLRPFGESGPPVTSFAALEPYLAEHGRGWERYAYTKARIVDTGAPEQVCEELMTGIIEPFVYRRYIDYGVFESLRDMKALVDAEVKKRELESNIKLGPGGIREIEFIVQSLQLVRGGSERQLRCRGLRRALSRLGGGRGLSNAAVSELSGAYEFLRTFENALQAIRDQQTHDVPADAQDQARLALALDYPDWSSLERELDRQRRIVSGHFSAVAFREERRNVTRDVTPEVSRSLTALWDSAADRGQWRAVLDGHGYAQPDALAERISGFAASSAVRRLDSTARRRLSRLVPELFARLGDRERPQVALERVLNIVDRILRRSAYVALLNENHAALDRLVDLCGSSGYLADEIARYPSLLDEMLDPRLYSASIAADAMREDLGQRLAALRDVDSEPRVETLANFQRAWLFRIAVADVSGGLPIMKVSDCLTDLAEIVLDHALQIAWRDLAVKHGVPWCTTDDGRRRAGFGVAAYGKFGGIELSYRSDLDLIFLHDSTGREQLTDGRRPLDNGMFFGRLVRRLVHFLTTQTGAGAMYEVDTRLRPSGRSGLLVASIEAFERYQDENAWTWEHQALLRGRPVAGSAVVAREFERIRSDTLRNRVRRGQLAEDVSAMRAKMRKQLDNSDGDSFDLKEGQGGIGDIEFLVQYLVLLHARDHPAVIHYPDNIRQLGALGAAGCLSEDEVVRLQEAYKTYRLRLHRLALDEQPPVVAQSEFREERAFVSAGWSRFLS